MKTCKPDNIRTVRLAFLPSAALIAVAFGAFGCRWVGDFYIGEHNYRNKDYPYSIVRYQRFLEKYTKPTAKREVAMIRLGEAYMAMRAYHDAANAFAQYQQEFPNGRFADSARRSLTEVRQVAKDREQDVAQQAEVARQEAQRLEAEARQRPNDPQLLLTLGHAQYKIGLYKSAGESYLRAIELKPELREDPLVSERLIFDMNGNLIPVDPTQRVALQREREPLEVVGTYEDSRRGGAEFFSAARRFKIISGMVRNRSTRPILGVRVEVTLYDALEQILDVQAYGVGTLYPQQSRPFVVKFDLDVETMNRYRRFKAESLYQQ